MIQIKTFNVRLSLIFKLFYFTWGVETDRWSSSVLILIVGKSIDVDVGSVTITTVGLVAFESKGSSVLIVVTIWVICASHECCLTKVFCVEPIVDVECVNGWESCLCNVKVVVGGDCDWLGNSGCECCFTKYDGWGTVNKCEDVVNADVDGSDECLSIFVGNANKFVYCGGCSSTSGDMCSSVSQSFLILGCRIKKRVRLHPNNKLLSKKTNLKQNQKFFLIF